MPIYEYRCTSCGRSVDVIHSILGSGPEVCEVCGGTMRKALSVPAILFKGSGWAKKDARSASKPAAGATASKDGTTEGTSSGSSDGEAAAPSPDTGTKDKKTSTPAGASSASGSTPSGASPSSSGGPRASGSGDRSP